MLPDKAIIPVAGVSFYQDNVQQTKVGDTVVLTHAPENDMDKWAVEVVAPNSGMLGYVPASLAERFTNPNRGGTYKGTWFAEIVQRLEGEDMVGLRIQLTQT